MSIKKFKKTVQTENGIFEIIATNPTKQFTVPGIRSELKSVYGVDATNSFVWNIVKNRLVPAGLVSQISSTTRINHYDVVSNTKITELINQHIGFPKVRKNKVVKIDAVKNDDAVKIDVVKNDDAVKYNLLDYIRAENYNKIITCLRKYDVEESDEMVFVVLAIMGHCIKRNTTTFVSYHLFKILNFLNQMTILAKLEELTNKKCIARPEKTNSGDVGYRLNILPINFGLNISYGVLKPLEKDQKVVEEESPAEKISGSSLSNKQIGLGIIDYIKTTEDKIDKLVERLDVLVKKNAELKDSLVNEKNNSKILNDKVISLSSNYETLIKAAQKPEAEITLRCMSDLKKVVI